MSARRAQILRLHRRGVPAVEICARLMVSWQVVEAAIASVGADHVNPHPDPLPIPGEGEVVSAPVQPVVNNELDGGEPQVEAPLAVRTAPVVARKGRRPRAKPRPSASEMARREKMVADAVLHGRVTKCSPGAAFGWVPGWMRT